MKSYWRELMFKQVFPKPLFSEIQMYTVCAFGICVKCKTSFAYRVMVCSYGFDTVFCGKVSFRHF